MIFTAAWFTRNQPQWSASRGMLELSQMLHGATRRDGLATINRESVRIARRCRGVLFTFLSRACVPEAEFDSRLACSRGLGGVLRTVRRVAEAGPRVSFFSAQEVQRC